MIFFFFFLLQFAFHQSRGETQSRGTLLTGASGPLQRIAELPETVNLPQKRNYEGVGETVNNVLEKRGLQAKPQIVNLLSTFLESPVKPKTARRLFNGMAGEFPEEQLGQFKGVVHKLDGLHKKRERLIGTLAHMLNYTEAQTQLMKDHLSNKKITEIIQEVEEEFKKNATLNYKVQNLKRNIKGWGKVLLTDISKKTSN